MRIRSERCLMRPFEEADIDAFTVYRNDMRWMRYQGFKGKSKEEYRAALLGDASWEEGLQLAIVHRDTGDLIGDIYLKKEGSTYWLGYTISPQQARQGYALEAASAVIAELRAAGAACVKASVEPENAASIALLEKLRFAYVETCGGERIYTLPLV